MGEQKINVKLLERDIELILAEPRRLMMSTFAAPADDFLIGEDDRPPCGTVMCIAGTTVLALEQERGFFRKRFTRAFITKMRLNARNEAAEALGLTFDQAERLFYFKSWSLIDEGWPAQFSRAYNAAKSPQERAEVTVARIRHFIKTKGAE